MKFLDSLTPFFEKSDLQLVKNNRPSEELMAAVDLVVKNSHPNINYVSNYRKRLLPAVERTLAYTGELISIFTPPVKIDRNSWNINPQVSPLFVSEKEFLKFFSENNEINSFFKKTGSSSCFALLVMEKTERTFFGFELYGEILRRDVIKKSIHFSKHSIVAPSISEKDTKEALSLLILSLLAANSLKESLSLIDWKKELENERKILKIQLQIYEASIRKNKALLPDTDDDEIIKEAKEVVKLLDSKIAEVRAETDEPEEYLNKVIELLYHPEMRLKANPVKVVLNDMNIIVENTTPERIFEVNLLEFIASTGIKKDTMLIEIKK